MIKEIYVVEIQSYDYFGGNKCVQKSFEDFNEAIYFYDSRKKYDYDYGDAYSKTRIFKAHKEVI